MNRNPSVRVIQTPRAHSTGDFSWHFHNDRMPALFLLGYAIVDFVRHISDDDLEHYAMRTVLATEFDRLEEHLLGAVIGWNPRTST